MIVNKLSMIKHPILLCGISVSPFAGFETANAPLGTQLHAESYRRHGCDLSKPWAMDAKGLHAESHPKAPTQF